MSHQDPARRTVLKGAAWSLPVVTAGVATPLAAASEDDCDGEFSVTVPYYPPSTNNYTQNFAGTTDHFVVPQGVTEIDFQLAGGGGGVNFNENDATHRPAGAGDLIIGKLAVVPGSTLEIIVGNGGIGIDSISNSPRDTLIKGGGGYGNGGDVLTGLASTTTVYGAGSGGGASAILVNGEPLLVAGGGGAGGGWVYNGGNPVTWVDSKGGDAGLVAEGATLVSGSYYSGGSRYHEALGGPGANGGTPGINPNAGAPDQSATQNGVTWARRYGHSGNGRHGADGILSHAMTDTPYGSTQFTSGGGGGGYAGGASGDTYVFAHPSFNRLRAALGGGGGGGSSYVRSSGVAGNEVIVATHQSAGNATSESLQRKPGWAELTYDCV